ncbi:hypothetical protein F5B22DRAFT_650123 [Xylaria bambusicola]|uniref:uncharacterized protein n=1 Tax=Xylaria bambusicola TaxID=326684 RepID=UPI0020075DFE|nr:uncharacterized protein F5B22DRAFT_650123 [Xylaria bambusicola]KAI0508271.1 hypothetical protein F5B22DRAFT_650123 [Xylaria bambusicola]
MPKSTDQSWNPFESNDDKRSSFSLTGSLKSVRRAVSGRGRKSDKDADNDREVEALEGQLASSSIDPPPAYTETVTESSDQGASSASVQQAPPRTQSIYSRLRGPNRTPSAKADKFRFLSEFDTVFLIDDSSSMTWNDKGNIRLRSGELTRWEQTRNVIQQIVPICMRYDQDGVDIYFLNDPYHMHFDDPHEDEPGWSRDPDRAEGKASYAYIGVSDANNVKKVFDSREPMLNTPTGKRLGEIMDTYVTCYQARMAKGQNPPKPLNIIVITDGEASDKAVLRENLIKQAERLDAVCAPYHQLGVQFFQVGKDEHAAHYLRELDDGLGKYRRGKELRDIVDCVTHDQLSGESGGSSQLTADVILKVVLGAVNRHLDNQKIREGLLVARS